jgi:hypothetical protein
MKTQVGNKERIEFPNVQAAIDYARTKIKPGYIWVLYQKHWHIVGNYGNRKVWNGADSQCVIGNAKDMEYLAKNSM